ncbi:MAG: polyprenol monophosphomannose synthase [Deltaproteobacteria bacterium]|nr:MAG: polyprenol monophosphomannose synthase [Deltaproteobacteria bacterium]
MTSPRRVLVLTPTYNERDNLAPFIGDLLHVLPDAHLLVIDDSSPDGTGELADELAAGDERISVLHRPRKLGLGTAYVEGFRYALHHDYDTIFEMDTDLSHDARHLPSFLRALADGADVAVGSRNILGGGVVGWGLRRHLISRGGSIYARAILGVSVRDLTTGYKGYTRRALEQIDVESLRSDGYAFQIETTYRALCRGLQVVEVPIVFVDRRVGRSKLDGKVFAEAIVAVWRLRLTELLGR